MTEQMTEQMSDDDLKAEELRSGHRFTRAKANWFDGKSYFSWRFDGDAKGRYLILWGGDVSRKIVGIGSSDLHTGRDSLDLVDVDGVPTTVMRCTERYEKAVVATTNVNDAYSLITHRFAECDVRWLMPELWIAWKNAKAKLQRRRDEHDYKEARNKGTIRRKTGDERAMQAWTQKSDLRSAARRYGCL